MAIRYDPRLYTAGTAVFNPEPITRATEYVAKYRQAKNDALDQYFQKRMDSVNGAGMRTQDIPDFSGKLNTLREYYLANKDKLRKGDIQAQSNYEKLFRDTQNLVAESKARTAAREDALKAGMELRKEGGTVPDSFLTDLHANDLPLSDKTGKVFDVAPYITEPKPFDIAKHLKAYEDVPRNPGLPQVGETDPKTGKRVLTETEVFDDNAKNTIALRAGSAYQNDRSFQREVNRTTSDPNTKKQLEETYRGQFGKPPEHPEDYATAYILSQKQLTKTTQKLEDDKQFLDKQKYERDQAGRIQLQKMRESAQYGLQALRAKNQKQLADYRHKLKGLDKKQEDNVLDETFKSIEEDAHKNGEMHLVAGGKKIGNYYTASVPDIIKGELGKKNGKGTLEYPDEVGFNPDGTIKIIYYKTDEDGNRLSGNHVDNTKSNTITRQQFKAIIGKKLFGVKTASGADYGEDNDFGDEEEQDDEESIIPQTQALPKQKTKDPLKLF